MLCYEWIPTQLLLLFLPLIRLTNSAPYYSSCHSSCKTDLAAAKMQSEVSSMIGKYLSTGDRLHSSSSMTFYLRYRQCRQEHIAFDTHRGQLWGTAVVSIQVSALKDYDRQNLTFIKK